MNRARLIVALGLACMIACSRGGARSPVIASVNGRDLNRAQFDRFVALKMGEFTSGETPEILRSQMLDEYIKRWLVLDQALHAGMKVTDAELEEAMRDNPQMKAAATAPETREEIVNDQLVEKFYREVVLRDLHVPPQEIERYIKENQKRLVERAGFHVAEIRVQSRDEAEALRRQIAEGGDFAEVAKTRSEGPNAEGGGMAQYEEGQLPAVLEKAIKGLGRGDISPVVQSTFGFHIFKLVRRVEPHPLEDRRAELAEELIARKNQQAVDAALDRLLSSAAIKINDATLGFTYRGTLRHN